MTTIASIADALGLSKSTVSRALSGKGRIGEETRALVLEYAEQNDFQPQRYTKKKRRYQIGLYIPQDAYHTPMVFFMECMLGVSEACSLMGVDLLLINGTQDGFNSVNHMIDNHVIDGIIFMRYPQDERFFDKLADRGFPTALVGSSDNPKVIQVDTGNRTAARDLTTVLINQGFRRFALILGNMDFPVNHERRIGFEEAFGRAGLPREQQLVFNNIVSMKLIDNVLSNLAHSGVEGIICGDDVICSRVVSKLQSEGVLIPKDLAVASLYNSWTMDAIFPPVTTVNVPVHAMGNIVGRQLIHKMQSEEYTRAVHVDYEILIRRSTTKQF